MHKTKQESSLWRQLSPYLKGFHLFFLVAILFSIVSSIITVIGPDKLKEITDTITKGMGGAIDIDKITSIALTLAILYGVGALVSYSGSFIISTMISASRNACAMLSLKRSIVYPSNILIAMNKEIPCLV